MMYLYLVLSFECYKNLKLDYMIDLWTPQLNHYHK